MALFETGIVLMTSGIQNLINDIIFKLEVEKALIRHIGGDWGDINEDDKDANDHALKNSDTIFSAYIIENTKIWIITEWNRSVTTILLPIEY